MFLCLSLSLLLCHFLFVLASPTHSVTNRLFSAPGQPPGAFLHPLPRLRGHSNIPAAGQGGEDSREQAGARAEAQHHLPVLLQFRASGALPSSSAG